MLILLKTFSYNLKKFDVHLSIKLHSGEQFTDDNNSDYSDRQQVNHDHHWFAKAHFNEFSWANTVEKKVNLKNAIFAYMVTSTRQESMESRKCWLIADSLSCRRYVKDL